MTSSMCAVPTVWPSLSFPLFLSSHHCSILAAHTHRFTHFPFPLLRWQIMAVPPYVSISSNATHSCSLKCQAEPKSTSGQCQIGHLTPRWPFSLIKTSFDHVSFTTVETHFCAYHRSVKLMLKKSKAQLPWKTHLGILLPSLIRSGCAGLSIINAPEENRRSPFTAPKLEHNNRKNNREGSVCLLNQSGSCGIQSSWPGEPNINGKLSYQATFCLCADTCSHFIGICKWKVQELRSKDIHLI